MVKKKLKNVIKTKRKTVYKERIERKFRENFLIKNFSSLLIYIKMNQDRPIYNKILNTIYTVIITMRDTVQIKG